VGLGLELLMVIRKNRKIYVRKPEQSENNANNLLIQKGAIPVDFDGKPIDDFIPQLTEENQLFINDNEATEESKILDLLNTGEYAVKDILKKLELTWSEKMLRDYLKNQKEVETINKKPLRFTMKDSRLKQLTLYD
jgi:predicted Rossmann fold nucleotide-binding protein DprA/Smf involved in DNA uptake